ncbi:MAG: flagellar biosynthesis anti-sigma factor FlgM [Pseudomonadota bacterium]|nr:flagellar biosynthesis anti-sigma factor FlgM [Pseudomonadota bacterium]
MPDKIDGLGPQITEALNRVSQSKFQTDSKQDAAPKDGAAGSRISDSVTFTDTARQLNELAAAVEKVPVVDTQRVEQIKQLVDSGQYRVDSERVADRLIALEQMLGDRG